MQTQRKATKTPLTGNRSTKPSPAVRLGPSDSTSATVERSAVEPKIGDSRAHPNVLRAVAQEEEPAIEERAEGEEGRREEPASLGTQTSHTSACPASITRAQSIAGARASGTLEGYTTCMQAAVGTRRTVTTTPPPHAPSPTPEATPGVPWGKIPWLSAASARGPRTRPLTFKNPNSMKPRAVILIGIGFSRSHGAFCV